MLFALFRGQNLSPKHIAGSDITISNLPISTEVIIVVRGLIKLLGSSLSSLLQIIVQQSLSETLTLLAA